MVLELTGVAKSLVTTCQLRASGKVACAARMAAPCAAALWWPRRSTVVLKTSESTWQTPRLSDIDPVMRMDLTRVPNQKVWRRIVIAWASTIARTMEAAFLWDLKSELPSWTMPPTFIACGVISSVTYGRRMFPLLPGGVRSNASTSNSCQVRLNSCMMLSRAQEPFLKQASGMYLPAGFRKRWP